MHLAINATDVGRQRGGNESYLVGLLEGLRSQPDTARGDRFTLLACREGLAALAAWPWPDRFRILDTGPWNRWRSYLWQQTQVLRRERPDWFLASFLLPPVVPCRAAVVVHDLSFRAHPDYFPVNITLYMTLLVGWAVRRADSVIVVSEFTRDEMRRFYPSAAAKTRVVYNGVGCEFTAEGDANADAEALRRYGVRPPYILAVGNIHPRKNLGRLLNAYEQLKRARADLPPLVWVGVERWGASQLHARARAVGARLTGRVAPEDLPAFYRRAALLAYPSLYEGFGLPPVEAMACGTPVVASSVTCLPEVLGEAALLADPMDTADWADAIQRVLFDLSLRADLRERGLARAAQFSWAKTAKQILLALG
jgi:glycosyltransferase involved in cell wall biosynthesis